MKHIKPIIIFIVLLTINMICTNCSSIQIVHQKEITYTYTFNGEELQETIICLHYHYDGVWLKGTLASGRKFKSAKANMQIVNIVDVRIIPYK